MPGELKRKNTVEVADSPRGTPLLRRVQRGNYNDFPVAQSPQALEKSSSFLTGRDSPALYGQQPLSTPESQFPLSEYKKLFGS